MSFSEQTKKTAILILAGAFRWIQRNRHRLAGLARLLARPLIAAGRFAARYLLVHPFRLALFLRRNLRAAGLLGGGRWAALTQRLLVHGIVALIIIVVSVTNVSAHTTEAAPTGERSALFALIGGDEEISDEEFVDDAPAGSTPTYWNPDAVEEFVPGGDRDDIGPDNFEIFEPQTIAGGAVLQPTLSAGAPSVAPRTRLETYAVQPGDTLAGIAQRFGVSVNTIAWANKLTSRSVLRPGATLTILPVSGVTHTVRKGDTVEKIAKTYNTAPEKILAWVPAGALRVGDAIIVPDGQPSAPPRPPRPARGAPVYIGAVPPSSSAPGGGRFAWPTAWHRITQYYHWRHTGLDIDGDYTTPLYAAEDGVVTYAAWAKCRCGYGLYIDVDHGGGWKTRYGHASKVFVQNGERVVRGQAIGMVGSTGKSTGTHVHFEVLFNGKRLNPLEFIR